MHVVGKLLHPIFVPTGPLPKRDGAMARCGIAALEGPGPKAEKVVKRGLDNAPVDDQDQALLLMGSNQFAKLRMHSLSEFCKGLEARHEPVRSPFRATQMVEAGHELVVAQDFVAAFPLAKLWQGDRPPPQRRGKHLCCLDRTGQRAAEEMVCLDLARSGQALRKRAGLSPAKV